MLGLDRVVPKALLRRDTKNDIIRNNTFVFLDNGKIQQNFNLFYNPLQIQPCIEAYFLIGNREIGKKLLDLFMTNFYDGANSKLIYGVGGTIFARSEKSKMIILTDSAYTLYLLKQLVI